MNPNDASKILNLTSENDRKQTSFHELCMPPGYDENTDVIRGHPHSQTLNPHSILSLTISNTPNKPNKRSLSGNISESPAKLFKKELCINDVSQQSQEFQEKPFVNTTTDSRGFNNYTENMISNWMPATSSTNDGVSSEVEPILGLDSDDISLVGR